MSSRPPSCSMVFWRFKKSVPCFWRFGYVTYAQGYDLIRMGRWNGDDMSGAVVSVSEIEWKPYAN
ncbi:hypothetical protein LCGC14_2886690 [marine sediment metagenome]|uniref:Uncharacterized protein n=1 Tax=marine sediment metagenome TaxID=412755 RepID=A0A0F8XYP6_9ZZZZ